MTTPFEREKSPLDKKLGELHHLMNDRTHVCMLCGKSSLDLVKDLPECPNKDSLADALKGMAGLGL